MFQCNGVHHSPDASRQRVDFTAMEKLIVTLRGHYDDDWCTGIRGDVANALLALNFPGLTIHVRDSVVADSMMTITTLDPPVLAFVSLWTEQHYGDQTRAALELLGEHVARPECMAAYLVTESTPMPPPTTGPGTRTPGLANMALLRRPAELDESIWLTRWHVDHTPVAIATQATFGYVQNHVVRPVTKGAAPVSAIVEELFPIEAISSLHAFFGAADDADLQRRLTKMVASTAAFGANSNIDAVPTSRYMFRDPFLRARG